MFKASSSAISNVLTLTLTKSIPTSFFQIVKRIMYLRKFWFSKKYSIELYYMYLFNFYLPLTDRVVGYVNLTLRLVPHRVNAVA